SFIVECPQRGARLAWFAFGPPCRSVYFPVVLDGDLPAEFTGAEPGALDSVWQWLSRLTAAQPLPSGRAVQVVDDKLTQLQARFDHTAEEYLSDVAALAERDVAERHRLATVFMRHNVEHFEDTCTSVLEGFGVEPEVVRSSPRGVAALPV